MNAMKKIFRKYFLVTGSFLLCFIFNGHSQNVTNYTFSATTGTFTQIQGTGGSVSPGLSGGNTDDGYFNSIPIGFTFYFEGISYTTLSASTNGWLTLGNTLAASVFSNNLNTGTPRPIIAPLWDDLAENAAGNFTYLLSGSSPNQVLTIEWLNMKWNFASTAGISFQVKLYESNKRIEFIYRQDAGAVNSASASIGLAGSVSSSFLSLNGTGASPTASYVSETTSLNSKPATGQIYRFDFITNPTITTVSPLSGLLGSTVTISGSGFNNSTANNIVYFGAKRATVLTASTTQLTVSVPVGATYEAVTVTNVPSGLSGFAQLPYDVTFGCGGTIAFGSNVDFAIGSSCRYSAFSDIDGDGKSDLAVTNDLNGTKTVSVFRNTSSYGIINSSSMAAKVDFTTTNAPGNVIFGDVDGDGKKDMLVAAGLISGDSICVYRNTATAGVINSSSFASKVKFLAGGYPTVMLNDIDGDGKPEMIVSNRTINTVTIYRNTATIGSITTSSFAAGVSFPTGTGPYYLAVADIDGDDKPDVITVNITSNTISVLRNTSSVGVINASTLAAKIDFALPASSSSNQVMAEDIDGDGKIDMICNTSAGFSIFRNTSTIGTITMAARADFSVPFSGGGSFAISDIDGDGKPEIAILNNTSNSTTSIFRNTSSIGSCSFASAINFSNGSSPFWINFDDIDGDAKPEMVIVNLAGQSVSLYQNIISPFNSIAPSGVLNSTSYCDNGIWQTYYDPANPSRVLAAIKDNGNNLGTITVNEYEDGAPGNYNGIRYLARHFKITPTTQPSSSVQVRLYFTNAELASLQLVDPSIASAANLAVTKYDGPTEDGIYSPGDATSLINYPQGSMTTGTAYSGQYLEFTVSSFSEFWLHGGTGVLPIELLNFSAAPENDHVNLNWSTATETNNDYFTIEKTSDGINFETVAIVDGAGNSTHLLNYSAIDENPFAGTSYYRLKQTDFNGQYSYSEIVPVNFTKEEDLFSVYPNPAHGSVKVICPGDKNEMVELSIIDATGKLISTSTTSIGELDELQLNLSEGMYSIVVTRGSTRFIRRVLIF